jgi:hypothetical protein
LIFLKIKKILVIMNILLILSLFVLASNVSMPTVKAASTTSVFLYVTVGAQSVTANNTAMTMGASTTFTNGDTVQFQVTPFSGFQFLCFVYADSSGAVTSTYNPYTKTLQGSCALEAICVPTSNQTSTTVSGSGQATIVVFSSIGGTTNPAGSTDANTTGYGSYVIGHSTTLTQTPGNGFKFLCWMVQVNSTTVYTSDSLTYTPISTGTAIQAVWIPTSSSVTLPTTVDEFSSAVGAILALVLVGCAFGAFAYTKKYGNNATKAETST